MSHYSTAWCEILRQHAFDYRKDGQEEYYKLIDMIRSVDDGAFGVCSAPNCRHHYASMAVMQLKDVPWSYLFQCMKISAKHFDSVILPPKLAPDFVKHIRADFTFCVCAWYDTEHDGIHVLAYNGHYHEEENTGSM